MEELSEEALFEVFEYLDELRKSGRTNMFGSPAFIQNELAWERQASLAAAHLWMQTFDGKAALAQRVAQAIEAQRAETAQTGSVADESAVGNADAPKGDA